MSTSLSRCRMSWVALPLFLTILLSSSTYARASITYNIVDYFDYYGAHLTGQITTDGNVGEFLSSGDIVAMKFQITTADGTIYDVPSVWWTTGNFFATASALSIPQGDAMTLGGFDTNGDHISVQWNNGAVPAAALGAAVFPADGPAFFLWDSGEYITGGLGGTDPWIIATATVPEPTTLIIWSLLGAIAITVGWRRRKAA